MNQVMHAEHPIVPRPWQGTYLDGVTGAGRDVREAWDNTLACLWRMDLSSQPINLWKYKLLQVSIPLLSVVLCDSQYQLGKKALGQTSSCRTAHHLNGLQGLAGKLNFVG